MSAHAIIRKTYYIVFATLLVLTLVTVQIAFLNLGRLNTVIALTIAFGKALLVILYFMHVRYSSRLTWLVGSAGFVWLSILIGLTLSDYLTRAWLPVPGR